MAYDADLADRVRAVLPDGDPVTVATGESPTALAGQVCGQLTVLLGLQGCRFQAGWRVSAPRDGCGLMARSCPCGGTCRCLAGRRLG